MLDLVVDVVEDWDGYVYALGVGRWWAVGFAGVGVGWWIVFVGLLGVALPLTAEGSMVFAEMFGELSLVFLGLCGVAVLLVVGIFRQFVREGN